MKPSSLSSPYSNMSIKDKIAHDCGGTQLVDDVNHPMRQYFRCWLDGSYSSRDDTYQRNCEFIKANYDNHKRMRGFVINQFCSFLANEYTCSLGHAQHSIVACIPQPTLNRLNDLLIDDALDLVDEPTEESE